ncbi:MAG: heme biosynthesis HemY N-terminal domain-containing protein [Moraxellaceae bacterium]|nr:heme biosynthesis HemY N-terminal domain-containing protein [Moraxellaceae bacterium]
MRALFWLLGLFTFAVTLAVLSRYNSAYALLVLPPYRVQISMNLLALLTVAAFIGFYLLLRLIARTIELPGQVEAWRQRRRRQAAAEALQDGSRLYLEGRYGQAYRHAEAAYDGGFAPGLSALLAAKAAQALREPERRQQWLDRAAENDRDIHMARLMVETEHAVNDRRFDVAATLLEQLRNSGHRHIAALRLSLQTEQGRGRWEEVARIARQLRKYRALTPEQAAPLLRRAQQEQLREADGDLEALRRLWQSIPEEERQDPRFLVRALPLYIGAGDELLAVKAIESVLDKDWEPELAVLYGRCKSTDLRAQLATAERWLKAHPDDAGLLLTLGRLCLRAQLWGKAESYLEASLSMAPSRAAHLELARLAESLERHDKANQHFRAAAELGA